MRLAIPMSVRHPPGAPLSGQPASIPDLSAAEALMLARQMKALADPTRLQIVDALRKVAPRSLCQCELMPLFSISQQALSKHLKTLTTAGVLRSERRGVWRYYDLEPHGLQEVSSWLG